MVLLFLRRSLTFTSVVNSSPVRLMVYNLCSRTSRSLCKENGAKQPMIDDSRGVGSAVGSANYSSRVHLSPLSSPGRFHLEGFKIELVDPETWQVSSGLAQAWRETDGKLETLSSSTKMVDEPLIHSPLAENETDFDEIEDMRIRGNLFYKLDRDSREFEEYNFSFRQKKSSRNSKEKKKESKNMEKPNNKLASGDKKLPKPENSKSSTHAHEKKTDNSFADKKLRTPTFNQVTAPYHEPFCLDIYISKSSVRACIVHRVTSKVVAVAHSISKDMKFDLLSTKDSNACATVGEILAQRALADDIHDVVYTPRRGERLEGKLQIVLQSVIDHGINVKVKIKQKRAKKAGHPSMG